MKNKKFKEVNQQLNLVNVELGVLNFWEKDSVFEKVNLKNEKKKEWVYYDGPITANGLPHYGHAVTWAMKDVVPRYWTMKGYKVPRNIGWDCQGILVEYEVEKSLGFKRKEDIEKFGIHNFNEKCRESVLKYRKSMIEYERRLGRWLDEDQYSTMDPSYIESIWWSISELYKKGLLYEGYKVVAYSTRAGMTLSTHEVADGGYKDVTDPAVTIKFKVVGKDNTYILAWTTTPWTLPGNLMLAVGKSIKYIEVEYSGSNYILAEASLNEVFRNKRYKKVRDLKVSELEGLEYEPPFNYYSDRKKEGAFKVIFADHVNVEEGTGIVHLAPYGEEDFVIFLEMGLKLFDYLDETGHFTNEVPDYEGLFYKKANERIIEDLKKNGLLFDCQDYVHPIPVSYRTKEPLIYKPIKSWYVGVDKFRSKLIEEAERVKFVPQEMGIGRFVRWIKGARDWSLSRRRYWGTPMPVWVNDKTGDVRFIGSFGELEELSGRKLGKDFDPHKPFVDEIAWKADGGTYRRVPEVVDVWYDSGSMPFAQFHYPFENKNLFRKRFPAEYISEGDDQLRLWFYTMFVLGIALFGRSPFKNVIVIGMLGDEKGKKMSKSAGNFPPVEEVFEKYGSDMLRYFLLSSKVARGAATAFSYHHLLETRKEFFTVLWNSYRYFVTYANLNDFVPENKWDNSNILDKWILIRLNKVIRKIRDYMDNYEVMYAAREFAPFVSDLSTWYIRRSRDRLSSGDKDALNTLYYVLVRFSKLMSPFMPFLSEEIYRNLVVGVDNDAPESVHLCDYPEFDDEFVNRDKKLLDDMALVRKIASLGNSIRKGNNIPVRQPLKQMEVSGVDGLDSGLVNLLIDELNVKKVLFVKSVDPKDGWIVEGDKEIKIGMDTNLTEELKVEGYARELIREIQKLRKQANVKWDAKVKVQYKETEEFKKAVEKFEKHIKVRTLLTQLVPGDSLRIIPNRDRP